MAWVCGGWPTWSRRPAPRPPVVSGPPKVANVGLPVASMRLFRSCSTDVDLPVFVEPAGSPVADALVLAPPLLHRIRRV